MSKTASQVNVFAQTRPIVLERLTNALDIEALVGDLPLSREYQGKLLNYAMIEMGVAGLGASNGIPFKQTAEVANKIAKEVTLAFEIFGEELKNKR